jgi:tetratricopeptide (TPR) repeat protein
LVAGLALVVFASAHGDTDDVTGCLDATESATQTIAHCTSATEVKGLADDKRAALFTQRGLARMSVGDLERAGDDFDTAIRLDGGSSWAYNARAVVWMQKGDVDHAIADYERAVNLMPSYAFAWANLGNARLIKGDTERALADLGEAIRLAPTRIELALTGRGKAWLAKGDFDRALDDFEAALKANPKYANALSGRAYARFCQGSFDAAAADFASERLIRKDAESAIDLVIAARRGGHDGRDELAEVSRGFDTVKGLPPGLALFSGAVTPEQALQASSDRDPNVKRQRLCAASFEVGEWYLLLPDLSRARQYLTMARETCDPSQPDFSAAGAELSRLK